MYSLIYVSSASVSFTDEELVELLKRSRESNAKLDITGLLLHKDGNFMQVLEGPQAAVRSLYARIEKDPRHRGLIILRQAEQDEREFGEWAMAFEKVETGAGQAGYSDFLQDSFTSPEFQLKPGKALSLLLSFKKVVR